MMRFLKKKIPTLIQWKRAQIDFAQATQAGKAMMEASKKHRSEHPLSEETVAAILAAFVEGKPLCCEKGLKTLFEIGLDECWILDLNEWAYENVGCHKYDQPGGCCYEAGLKKLCHKLKKGV